MRLRQLRLSDEEEAKHFFINCYNFASTSRDPRTQVGVAIVTNNNTHIYGKNEPMPGFDINDPIFDDIKYGIMEHAERTAIFMAVDQQINIKNSTIYSPWGSCTDCSRAIVLSGIKKMVRHKELTDQHSHRWQDSINLGEEILKNGGVEIIDYSFQNLGAKPILMDGKIWQP